MSENLIAPNIEKPDYKLHKRGSFKVAAFFGGIPAVGIMMFRNYQNLNEDVKARNALIISIVITIIYLVMSFVFEEVFEYIPNLFISLIFLWLADAVFNKFLLDYGKNHKENQGEYFNGWYTFSIIILSIFISLILVLVLAVFFDPELSFSDLLNPSNFI